MFEMSETFSKSRFSPVLIEGIKRRKKERKKIENSRYYTTLFCIMKYSMLTEFEGACRGCAVHSKLSNLDLTKLLLLVVLSFNTVSK